MRGLRIGFVAAVLCSWLTAAAGTAVAQTDVAAAQVAFDDAKRLVAKGDYANACPKFAESLRLDPQPGTEFNLADCDEHAGKTATAWSHFVAVADMLSVAHDAKRSGEARARANALEPKLMRLVITADAASGIAGLHVQSDKQEVGRALWGSAVPVDPGPHTISASAPGYQDWQQTVTLSQEGATVTVAIPALQQAAPSPASTPQPGTTPPAPAAESTPPAEPGSSGLGGQKVAALVTGGVGVVGIVMGAIFAASASSNWSSSQADCASSTSCRNYQQATSEHDSAQSEATASTISFIAGGALVAAGAVIWLTAPKPHAASETGIRLVPSVQPRGTGLSLEGIF